MITYTQQLKALINLKNNPSLLGPHGVCHYMLDLRLLDNNLNRTIYELRGQHPALFTYEYPDIPCKNNEVGMYCGIPGEMTPERQELLDLLIKHYEGLVQQ